MRDVSGCSDTVSASRMAWCAAFLGTAPASPSAVQKSSANCMANSLVSTSRPVMCNVASAARSDFFEDIYSYEPGVAVAIDPLNEIFFQALPNARCIPKHQLHAGRRACHTYSLHLVRESISGAPVAVLQVYIEHLALL